MATFRYLVTDVEAAIAFYTERLGFTLRQQMGPAFAIVARADLSLWLAGPRSSAARPMPDGRTPEPGGWNRLALGLDGLEAEAAPLKEAGGSFRNGIVTGPGGKRIFLDDPDGNPLALLRAACATNRG